MIIQLTNACDSSFVTNFSKIVQKDKCFLIFNIIQLGSRIYRNQPFFLHTTSILQFCSKKAGPMIRKKIPKMIHIYQIQITFKQIFMKNIVIGYMSNIQKLPVVISTQSLTTVISFPSFDLTRNTFSVLYMYNTNSISIFISGIYCMKLWFPVAIAQVILYMCHQLIIC